MELLRCPLHASLLKACIGTILQRHAPQLPDLSDLVVLTPDSTSKTAMRKAIGAQIQDAEFGGCILPEIADLRQWTLRHCASELVINELSETLELVLILKAQKSQAFERLNEANTWTVAREMIALFEDLWLNDANLFSTKEELTQYLQTEYGLAETADSKHHATALAHLETEAGIVHLLWQAWDQGSSNIVSPGKCYREALRKLPDASLSCSHLYVCGYESLMAAEILALDQLSAHIPVTIFAREHSIIPHTNEKAWEGHEMSSRATFFAQAFAHSAGTITERAQICRTESSESSVAKNLRLLAAAESEPHAVAIEVQIRDWLQQGRRNIGLITEDRKLARRISTLLGRTRIHMNDSSGWALSTTSAASLIHNWLECVSQDFHHLHLWNILKSPFVALPEPATPLEDRLVLVRRLEQLIREKNISRSFDQYRTACQSEPEITALLDAVEEAAKPSQATHNSGARGGSGRGSDPVDQRLARIDVDSRTGVRQFGPRVHE